MKNKIIPVTNGKIITLETELRLVSLLACFALRSFSDQSLLA